MNDYIALRLDFERVTTPGNSTYAKNAGDDDTIESTPMAVATDIMAAMLADCGYESFVPDENGLTAYVRREDFSSQALRNVLDAFPLPGYIITAKDEVVEGRDWNHEWEKNYFKPIVVGNQCVIHSSFHTDYPVCRYDITIDPKMAFGTGHHATTSQMIEALLSLPLQGATVTDMGTGTGILAIVAAMAGATQVTGIEIDDFAAENALSNVATNGHPEINIIHGDASALPNTHPADVFLANINRNIITADLPAYAAAMRTGATLLLSGFYEDDIPVIMAAAEPLGFTRISHTAKSPDRWACLHLQKN